MSNVLSLLLLIHVNSFRNLRLSRPQCLALGLVNDRHTETFLILESRNYKSKYFAQNKYRLKVLLLLVYCIIYMTYIFPELYRRGYQMCIICF